jgi:hypothetical protein
MAKYHVLEGQLARKDIADLTARYFPKAHVVTRACNIAHGVLGNDPHTPGWEVSKRKRRTPAIRILPIGPLFFLYQIDDRFDHVTIRRVLDHLPKGTPPIPSRP